MGSLLQQDVSTGWSGPRTLSTWPPVARPKRGAALKQSQPCGPPRAPAVLAKEKVGSVSSLVWVWLAALLEFIDSMYLGASQVAQW